MQITIKRSLLFAGISLSAMLVAGVASAQTTAAATSELEELVVTGSRSKPRTVQDSPVPIDAYGAEEISSVAVSDTMDVLKTLVPSYTLARQPISDGSSFIRPASLRGLPGDKTLLLVNSKRRHRAALVPTGGSGSQAADAAVIPSSALKSVEVLRDGAGAQYGSDAVAGVINFILKDNDSGGSLSVMAGQYYEGDGDLITVTGNKGFKLGDSGFLSASFEYITEQPTSRGRQYCNVGIPNQSVGFCAQTFGTNAATAAYAASVGWDPTKPSVLQKWGQLDTKAFRSFVNGGYTFGNGSELYAFANYSQSHQKEDFNYRNPIDVGASTNQLDDYVRLADGSLWRANSIFPLGFTPQFFGDVTDYSLTAGYKGTIGEGLGYDLSARYGNNKIEYKLTDTVNFSMGPASPTEFHPGDLIADEYAVNADFTYEWKTGFTSEPVFIAFGAEYRNEGYEIVTGDTDSYIAGVYAVADPYDFCTNEATVSQRTLRSTAPQNMGINCASASDPVYKVLGVGSNGFPGYPPLYSGSLERDSYAAYVDASADVTDRLFVQASLRGENFSDFGSTVDFKLAGRFEFSDAFALRGSVGTGFRAPTPGQQFTTVVSTVVNNGQPVAQGLFPATNPVAQYLGAKELDPEKAKSVTLGITSSLPFGLDLTVDAYYITIDDMFYGITPITVTSSIQAAMIAAGIPGADTIGQITFFQNAFDAKVAGLDIVATYQHEWANGQTTDFSASFNYNQKIVDTVKQFVDSTGQTRVFFDGEYVYDFKHADPYWKSVLSATHHIGPVTILGRANIYGPYKNMFSVSNPIIQEWDPEVQFDLDVTWDIDDTYTLTVGARNIFDEYPAPDATGESGTNGRIYRSDSLVDWQGGFYYAKVAAKF
ncbi:MAG: TonB-dependent receptor plug domain-containing protein [Phenylobacterium sp.]|uniref:TonB-dependent receptor plug domain-containing protein n=1 Tax=Phenylobacterium sp. TaxID=1871053 RepID=UPI00391C2DFF